MLLALLFSHGITVLGQASEYDCCERLELTATDVFFEYQATTYYWPAGQENVSGVYSRRSTESDNVEWAHEVNGCTFFIRHAITRLMYTNWYIYRDGSPVAINTVSDPCVYNSSKHWSIFACEYNATTGACEDQKLYQIPSVEVDKWGFYPSTKKINVECVPGSSSLSAPTACPTELAAPVPLSEPAGLVNTSEPATMLVSGSEGDSKALGVGGIVGITAGGVAFIGLGAYGLVWYFYRRGRNISPRSLL